MPSSVYSVHQDGESPVADENRKRVLATRLLIFIGVLLVVAGGGLIYDYSRPAVYRAISRVAVEPPGALDDSAKAQFALNEAQAMRRSDLMQSVVEKLQAAPAPMSLDARELERGVSVEHVPQTNVIELRGEGHDRHQLVSVLGSWIEAYISSRKDTDRADETDALEEAKHAARITQKAVEDKQREMEGFRQRHGIISSEREENPSAAQLKGLHATLNEAAAREFKAEARLKAVKDGLDQGRGTIRASDKPAIAGLEMRAVDLREKVKDLEHDFTQQYLALDPKYKALKANLHRVEQQIEQEKERSQKAALIEAQEDLAGAQRETQKVREQAGALKAESQTFSTRFAELKRLGTELEQLQDARRDAFERQVQLESARKPTAVRIRVLSAPSASETPIAPDYSRDAAIAIAAGLVLAVISVWLHDYLRRESRVQGAQAASPIIQIAYPLMSPQAGVIDPRIGGAPPAGLIGSSPPSVAAPARELTQADVSALWASAPPDERLVIAAIFAGIAPNELTQLRWSHVDLEHGLIHVPGSSARDLTLVDPMRSELTARLGGKQTGCPGESRIFADGAGNALDESMLDGQIACVAHDAGLRHPEEVNARSLHFTYAAYLARQGIRMVDLSATIGRMNNAVGAELMRLAPSSAAVAANRIERVYASFLAPAAQSGDQSVQTDRV